MEEKARKAVGLRIGGVDVETRLLPQSANRIGTPSSTRMKTQLDLPLVARCSSLSRSPAMATATASKRLAKEYALMQKDPPPFCFGRPLESDVLTWHFILRGPPDTPYQDGEYWGQLMFP